MATDWVMHSLSYWHNQLTPNATNCTVRGPNCFTPGVNTSCRTETSAYTALKLADGGDASHPQGWVAYDMHGINFAMKFTLSEDP